MLSQSSTKSHGLPPEKKKKNNQKSHANFALVACAREVVFFVQKKSSPLVSNFRRVYWTTVKWQQTISTAGARRNLGVHLARAKLIAVCFGSACVNEQRVSSGKRLKIARVIQCQKGRLIPGW